MHARRTAHHTDGLTPYPKRTASKPAANGPAREAAGSERGSDRLSCVPDGSPRERNGSAEAADASQARTNRLEPFADGSRHGTESSEHGADCCRDDENGSEPAHTTLFRALKQLRAEGTLKIEDHRSGGVTTRYRKTTAEERA